MPSTWQAISIIKQGISLKRTQNQYITTSADSPGMIHECGLQQFGKNERDSTAFISLKLVLVYRSLISNTCDMSHTGNRFIMPQYKVKGWQRELPDSLAN